jgi:flagellar motor switch protein FliG
MSSLKISNSLTKSKDLFKPINPKNINRILAFEKQEFKGNKKAMKVAMTNIVVDVMNELSSDEQQELMDAVKQ